MAHPLYARNLQGRIATALSEADQASDMDHPGLRGKVREIVVKDLLSPILPPGVEIGTGKIVDHVGGSSAEVDIVIYDRSLMPPLLYGATGDLGVFPVEACIYAIQVKSQSTAANLSQAIDEGKALGGLTYLREACGPNGHPLSRVIPAYFAFRSDLVEPRDGEEPRELARWRSRHDPDHLQREDHQTPTGFVSVPFPPVRVLCVAGQGYGFYDGQRYCAFDADGPSAEIAAFVVGVANTLIQFSTRQMALPFGYYLSPPTQLET